MALEAGTYIDDLVATNPPQSDSLTQAAGHLRLLKATILATFPNVTGAVTATHTALDAAAAAVAAAQYVPAGSIFDFAGASLPSGYLWCDGTSYLRADYAGLFTAISTTWGSADGTHFNVPNFKDRFRVGKATMGDTADAAIIDSLLTSTTLGATYDGEGAIDTITLAEANIPAHTHTFSASGTTGAEAAHTHTFSATTSSNGDHSHTVSSVADVGSQNAGTGNQRNEAESGSGTTNTTGAHTHTVSGTTAAGSSHTHSFSASGSTGSIGSTTAFTVAILPPSAVVNVIIKT
jgi:microcystin-dependent protein